MALRSCDAILNWRHYSEVLNVQKFLKIFFRQAKGGSRGGSGVGRFWFGGVGGCWGRWSEQSGWFGTNVLES